MLEYGFFMTNTFSYKRKNGENTGQGKTALRTVTRFTLDGNNFL